MTLTDEFIQWAPDGLYGSGGAKIYFVNLSRVDVFQNHVVYVRGAGSQIIGKIIYGTDQDTKLFADLLMGFRKSYYQQRDALQSRQAQEYIPQRQEVQPGEIPLIKSSPPYTFFLLNDDMKLNRNRQFLV
jgi:hypothetical protein